jgi:hypothetical protein
MTVPNNDKYAGPWVLPIPRVGNVYLKAQNSTIAPTTLVAAAPSGLYRVSVAMAIKVVGGGGQLTFNLVSTGDDTNAVTQSLVALNVNTLSIAQDAFICEVGSASNITFNVTAVGLAAGGLQYTLRLVAEQLSLLT